MKRVTSFIKDTFVGAIWFLVPLVATMILLSKAHQVTSKIVKPLAHSAAKRVAELKYTNIETKHGDGYYGWLEQAPFDAIIVTAAPDHLPSPLATQLAEGGRLVIPIGPPGGYQSLWKFVKEGADLKAYNLGGVAVVPFTGEGVKEGPEEPLPLP